MLHAKDISYTFAGADSAVLDAISMDASKGEVVEIVGPSGAGKTTLLRALAMLLPEASGELRLRDTAAKDISPQEWRSAVVLLPQRPTMFPGTVQENLLTPWSFKVKDDDAEPSQEALRQALDDVGLSEIELDRSAKRLSVGQAARVALLRVLLTNPQVMLLDEPDASLDDDTAHLVSVATGAFVEGGGAVVRVGHLRDDKLASRRLRLWAGRLEEVTDGD